MSEKLFTKVDFNGNMNKVRISVKDSVTTEEVFITLSANNIWDLATNVNNIVVDMKKLEFENKKKEAQEAEVEAKEDALPVGKVPTKVVGGGEIVGVEKIKNETNTEEVIDG